MARVANPALAKTLIARQLDRTVSVWRIPAKTDGKTGPRASVGSVAIQILAPTGELAARLEQAPDGASGGRITHMGRCLGSADIRVGDELRGDGEIYLVIGTDLGSDAVQRTATLSKVEQ